MQCDYRIHVSQGSTVSLIVTDLEMEVDPDCSMDYIAVSLILTLVLSYGVKFDQKKFNSIKLIQNSNHFIRIFQFYDGADASARHLGTYCHANQVVQLESSSNDLFIRMVSDISNEGRGFEIKFNASMDHLGHRIAHL